MSGCSPTSDMGGVTAVKNLQLTNCRPTSDSEVSGGGQQNADHQLELQRWQQNCGYPEMSVPRHFCGFATGQF